MRQRRFLPSFSLLSAFEAVLRTGSTSAAARELNQSQSSVSRHVQNLEKQLSQRLFVRHRQKLIPTEAAFAYSRDVRRALDLIQRGSMRLAANPDGGSLSLAILPAFGAHWLIPRLGNFLAASPSVNINIATRLKRIDFGSESFDAAVYFGGNDWPNVRHMCLFDEKLVACLSPSLVAGSPPASAHDLMSLPLLRLETRPNAWRRWFAAHDLVAPSISGVLFDQFATMTQAAVSGLGVALLPDYVAEAACEKGHLIKLFSTTTVVSGTYRLVWPEARETYAPLATFRHWLQQEIDLTTA